MEGTDLEFAAPSALLLEDTDGETPHCLWALVSLPEEQKAP